MQDLKAVILVGGPGTRLQPLTYDIPKPIVPVMNRPFLEHTIAYLRKYGIRDIILTLNFMPDAIRSYFGDGSDFGVRLTYCLEEEPLGTAGAVKNTESFLDGTFIVLNGDIFTDMDLEDMIAKHRANKAIASISLSWVDNPSAFGVVATDDANRVSAFIEKPPPGEATTNWINAGFYVLEPEVLDIIPANTHYMFERGVFPGLVAAGKPVYGYPFQGYWLDMGTPDKYYALVTDLLDGRTSSPLFPEYRRDSLAIADDAVIDSTAVITPPVVIDSGSRIGAEVEIKGPVVIGRDCRLEADVKITNAVLWNGVSARPGARLSRCIVGSDVKIEGNRKLIDAVVTTTDSVPLTV